MPTPTPILNLAAQWPQAFNILVPGALLVPPQQPLNLIGWNPHVPETLNSHQHTQLQIDVLPGSAS